MQPDVIETYGGSRIQHGKLNDRIYLMKAAAADVASLPKTLRELARQQGYSKIFAKLEAIQAPVFLDEGYVREAQIPQFFNSRQPALLLGCFLDKDRAESRTAETNEQVMATCRKKRAHATTLQLPEGAELRACVDSDAEGMATLYGCVFQTYPFPIDDPAYIRRTMVTHIIYFGVWIEGELVALASAEMDTIARNAEMTDFATLPDYRGKGLATILLDAMEAKMRERDIATVYTIARAPSFGMNITFARMGYDFGGRLINNTNIAGRFEDMNVWHKGLASRL